MRNKGHTRRTTASPPRLNCATIHASHQSRQQDRGTASGLGGGRHKPTNQETSWARCAAFALETLLAACRCTQRSLQEFWPNLIMSAFGEQISQETSTHSNAATNIPKGTRANYSELAAYCRQQYTEAWPQCPCLLLRCVLKRLLKVNQQRANDNGTGSSSVPNQCCNNSTQ